MIDWHSHVLPGIDDGSRNITESIGMLKMLAEQNVDTVIATPHFYANNSSVDTFIKRRNEAYISMSDSISDSMPRIYLGAEVAYYDGISRLDGLEKLRIENSKLLLLEMPSVRWSDYTVSELMEMSSISGMRLILAHIERYMHMQKAETFGKLLECGICMQINASCFDSLWTRRKALQMLSCGAVKFIGSDCHNLSTRRPNISHAFEYMEKKLGRDFLNAFNEYGHTRFTNNN